MAHVVIRVGKDLIESVITRRSAEEMKLKGRRYRQAVIQGSTEVMLDKGLTPSECLCSLQPSVWRRFSNNNN